MQRIGEVSEATSSEPHHCNFHDADANLQSSTHIDVTQRSTAMMTKLAICLCIGFAFGAPITAAAAVPGFSAAAGACIFTSKPCVAQECLGRSCACDPGDINFGSVGPTFPELCRPQASLRAAPRAA